jgi:hypothetical protein
MRQQKERSNYTHLGKGHPHTATHTPPRFFIITGSPWTVQSSSSCWCLVSLRIWCQPVLAATTNPVFFWRHTHTPQHTLCLGRQDSQDTYRQCDSLHARRVHRLLVYGTYTRVRRVNWASKSYIPLRLTTTTTFMIVASIWESPWYVTIVVVLMTTSILLPV